MVVVRLLNSGLYMYLTMMCFLYHSAFVNVGLLKSDEDKSEYIHPAVECNVSVLNTVGLLD
jgi:hypothetical protein